MCYTCAYIGQSNRPLQTRYKGHDRNIIYSKGSYKHAKHMNN